MAIGIKRNLDTMGRVSLPKDLREYFGLNPGDPVEIYCSRTQIIIEPSKQKCVICGKPTSELFKNRGVCPECRLKMLSPNF